MRPTPEQEKIITAPSGNILVSAAAGSGKTSVMTERIVTRILERQLSVDRVLVMTFTNAAAANMSAKLEKKLRERLSSEKDKSVRKYLSEQIAALPTAYISTINAFCSRVISSFSAQGKDNDGQPLLEPGSMVLEESHSDKLLSEAFDDAFAEAYQLAWNVKEDPSFDSEEEIGNLQDGVWPGKMLPCHLSKREWAESFLSMVEAFGSGRDDSALKEDMASKLAYLRSLPDYRNWITSQVERKCSEAGSFVSTPTCARILTQMRSVIRERLPYVKAVLEKVDTVVFAKTKKSQEEKQAMFKEWSLFVLESGEKILDENITWNEIVSILGRRPEGTKAPAYTKRSDCDISLNEFDSMVGPFYEMVFILTGLAKNVEEGKRLSRSFRFYFGKTEEELNRESKEMTPFFQRYFELILAADTLYAAKKKAEAALDFQDQEQMALKLLSNEEVAKYYQELFDEIYIDEYQDNSGVQDAIVQCFSRNNVFFVGDVKQSIYRFRHAKPQMFLDRAERYRKEEGGKLYELKANFRSVPGILDEVNEIFSAIMGREYADIEYDDSHKLNAGLASYEETSGARVTLLFSEDTTVPKADDSTEQTGDEDADAASSKVIDEDDAERVQKEALVVAGKIKELSELPDFSCDHCVVLTKSNKEAMAAADVLNSCGIPAQGPSLGNILQHPDLRVILDLARITDNSLQDIPLAGVMKSGILQGGFTDADLFEIFLLAQKHGKSDLPFHEKVVFFAEKAETRLGEKVRHFLSFINDLRTYAMQMSVSKWLEHVYSTTDYPHYVLTQKGGNARYYALMSFVAWASRFDLARRQGLRAFVEYIEELDSQKNATTEIDLSEPLENVVCCMTIHKSKGLEFPYVFLCGLQSGTKDSSSPVLLNESGEMAAKRYCPQWGSIYEPHDYFILKQEERRELEAEKIRLLYVALTRAEKKVFVVAHLKRNKDGNLSFADLLKVIQEQKEEKLPPFIMKQLDTPLKKTLAGLVREPSLPLMRVAEQAGSLYHGAFVFSDEKASPSDEKLCLICDSLERLSYNPEKEQIDAQNAYEEARKIQVTDTLSEEEKARVNVLSEDIKDWAALNLIPAKTTVSEMKRILAEEEKGADDEDELDARAVNLRLKESPDKWKNAGFSASQLGTLLHSAWQYIDFAGLLRSGEEVDWERELLKLEEYGMVSKEQAARLLPFTKNMQMFLDSELCRDMAKAETIKEHGPYREIPFALALPNGDDFSLIQGMIDCWFVDKDDQAVLIDYKSDRIEGTPQEKAAVLKDRYAFQLEMYEQAIVAATGKKVKKRIIWLIRDGLSFEI